MPRRAAGLLLYRTRAGALEVLLAHPGGPLWERKDRGAWSIPKGELDPGEDARAAALREFAEETGVDLGAPVLVPLDPVRLPSGKHVDAWAVEGDLDPGRLASNRFTLEWPPRSGLLREFPEVDRFEWFGIAEARERIAPGQQPLLDDLVRRVGKPG